MRKRRIDAKTRVAIRAFLDEQVGAVETCQFLAPRLSWDEELTDQDDTHFIEEVADHLSGTMLRTEWDPIFAAPKLKLLQRYEDQIKDDVRKVCEKILLVFEARKYDTETNEDS